MAIDEKVTIHLKMSLLSEGMNFPMDLFEDYPKDFYDNQFVYGQTSKGIVPKSRFPQVLRLGDDIVTALLRREESPWNLRREGENISIYHGTDFIRPVSLPEKPAYFNKVLSDGTLSENIIAVAGETTPGFFFYPDCYYFSEKRPCRFCSMKGTRNSVGKHMVSEFSEENIIEATKLFQSIPWKEIPIISITSGTPKTDEETIEYVLKPTKTMYEALSPKLPIHLLAHPPNNLDLIEEFQKAGVTSIAFNLETFDRAQFQYMCPGKDQLYGYEKWWDAIDKAREVFGGSNVFCGLVWGLESPKSTIEGNNHIASRGINIASNVFHADSKSKLKAWHHLSTEETLKISKDLSKIYRTNPNLRTIFPMSMRSTLDWEIYRGDLK